MGMFDYIQYNGKQYQTKDTSTQFFAIYEIRGDELWYKNVTHQWVDDDESLFGGYLEAISSEWERVTDFDGSIRFYDDSEEYLALFWEGKMIRIKQIDESVYNDSNL